MKKIMRFLWNWSLFIALPIPYLKVTVRGVSGGEWNTWFLQATKREYGRSVTQMMCIWTGLCVTILFSVSLHVACSNYSDRYLIDIVLSTIVILWIILLTPQIQLSYEIWNWSLVSSFTNNLRGAGIHDKTSFQKMAQDFLIMKFRDANATNDFEVFNHLEHIFRILDLWKGQRNDFSKLK